MKIRQFCNFFSHNGASNVVEEKKHALSADFILSSPVSTNIRKYQLKLYVMFYAIWYYLYNLKDVENTHGGVKNTFPSPCISENCIKVKK